MISFYRANKGDAEALLDIKINAFEWDLKTYGMGPPGYDSLTDLVSAINRALYYKIKYQDKLVGGFSLYKIDENHFEIGSIYVDPEYHNLGIGTEIIEFIEKTYPKVKKWTLDTPYLSFRNHHFYEKMGFVKVGETEPIENGFYLFKYEKNIG